MPRFGKIRITDLVKSTKQIRQILGVSLGSHTHLVVLEIPPHGMFDEPGLRLVVPQDLPGGHVLGRELLLPQPLHLRGLKDVFGFIEWWAGGGVNHLMVYPPP